jgi:hypothetical protein
MVEPLFDRLQRGVRKKDRSDCVNLFKPVIFLFESRTPDKTGFCSEDEGTPVFPGILFQVRRDAENGKCRAKDSFTRTVGFQKMPVLVIAPGIDFTAAENQFAEQRKILCDVHGIYLLVES